MKLKLNSYIVFNFFLAWPPSWIRVCEATGSSHIILSFYFWWIRLHQVLTMWKRDAKFGNWGLVYISVKVLNVLFLTLSRSRIWCKVRLQNFLELYVFWKLITRFDGFLAFLPWGHTLLGESLIIFVSFYSFSQASTRFLNF